MLKEKVTCVCKGHLTTLNPGRQKEPEAFLKTGNTVSLKFYAAALRTLISVLSSPDPGQMFLLCAWHVITTLICVVSLSPPTSLSLCSSVTFSNSLWKPKELVRAWLTLPPITSPHHSLHQWKCLMFFVAFFSLLDSYCFVFFPICVWAQTHATCPYMSVGL